MVSHGPFPPWCGRTGNHRTAHRPRDAKEVRIMRIEIFDNGGVESLGICQEYVSCKGYSS